MASQGEDTRLLIGLKDGNQHAKTDLITLLDGEFCGLPRSFLPGEWLGHTLPATALAHRAYSPLNNRQDKSGLPSQVRAGLR